MARFVFSLNTVNEIISQQLVAFLLHFFLLRITGPLSFSELQQRKDTMKPKVKL